MPKGKKDPVEDPTGTKGLRKTPQQIVDPEDKTINKNLDLSQQEMSVSWNDIKKLLRISVEKPGPIEDPLDTSKQDS